jgi:lipopolysaccharide/colanic/teichoic acid biosynthesis glycosyltransferase
VRRAHAKRLYACVLPADVLLSALAYAGLVSYGAPAIAHFQPTESGLLGLLLPGLVAALVAPLLLDRLDPEAADAGHGVAQIAGTLPLAVLVSTCALAVALALTGGRVASLLALAFGAAQLVLLGALRLAAHGVSRLEPRTGRNYCNVLIVGSGRRARHALHLLQRHRPGGLRVVGFVDEDAVPHDPRIPADRVFKLVDLRDIIRKHVIDEVIVACPRSMLGEIGPVVATCAGAGVPMTLLSDLFGDYLPPPEVTRLGTLAALRFAPVPHSSALLAVKRVFDVLGGAAGLLVALPVIALGAIAIAATGSGPVFTRVVRCGRHGRHFELISLGVTVDGNGDGGAASDRVGRILRRWRLDALPRFWNVLIGDMSLVGPRPPLPVEVAEYGGFDRRRLSMRPGLTCPRGARELRGVGEDQLRLDLDYIDTWSPANDARILLEAAAAVIRGAGA